MFLWQHIPGRDSAYVFHGVLTKIGITKKMVNETIFFYRLCLFNFAAVFSYTMSIFLEPKSVIN